MEDNEQEGTLIGFFFICYDQEDMMRVLGAMNNTIFGLVLDGISMSIRKESL